MMWNGFKKKKNFFLFFELFFFFFFFFLVFIREGEAFDWVKEIVGRDLGDDFQAGLKDGTALCELINTIQPGAVK